MGEKNMVVPPGLEPQTSRTPVCQASLCRSDFVPIWMIAYWCNHSLIASAQVFCSVLREFNGTHLYSYQKNWKYGHGRPILANYRKWQGFTPVTTDTEVTQQIPTIYVKLTLIQHKLWILYCSCLVKVNHWHSCPLTPWKLPADWSKRTRYQFLNQSETLLEWLCNSEEWI